MQMDPQKEASPAEGGTPSEPVTSLGERLLALTLTFGKFGGITFGGGYAIVALLEEELVQRRHWLTSEELLNIITVGESTPGPIAVNTATFVGYRIAGVLGGLVATVALVFPAWLVIVLISSCYLALRENVWVASALAGITPQTLTELKGKTETVDGIPTLVTPDGRRLRAHRDAVYIKATGKWYAR